MKKIKIWARAVILLLLPSRLIRFVGPLFGVSLQTGARIGFSLLLIDKLEMGKTARIKHFNIIKVNELRLSELAIIGNFNVIRAPTLDVILHENAAIGDQNTIYRSKSPITYGLAILEVGVFSKITYKHY